VRAVCNESNGSDEPTSRRSRRCGPSPYSAVLAQVEPLYAAGRADKGFATRRMLIERFTRARISGKVTITATQTEGWADHTTWDRLAWPWWPLLRFSRVNVTTFE
jgi:hypothetical protein